MPLRAAGATPPYSKSNSEAIAVSHKGRSPNAKAGISSDGMPLERMPASVSSGAVLSQRDSSLTLRVLALMTRSLLRGNRAARPLERVGRGSNCFDELLEHGTRRHCAAGSSAGSGIAARLGNAGYGCFGSVTELASRARRPPAWAGPASRVAGGRRSG